MMRPLEQAARPAGSASSIAQAFVEARRTGRPLDNTTLSSVAASSDGYAVQAEVAFLIGAKIAGWKVALPPDGEVMAAPIFADGVVASCKSLPAQACFKDGIECEIAFRIDRALPARPSEGYGIADVVPAIGGAMAAFELLSSRLANGFKSSRPQLLADNLGNGGVVLGEPCANWCDLDFERIAVALTIDGVPAVSQRGGNPVGDPLRAVAALANHLVDRGEALVPGVIVLTGAYMGVHRVRAGETIRGVFEGMPPIEVALRRALPTQNMENRHAGG
jgi:2-keto-4-pentenoate hydratase